LDDTQEVVILVDEADRPIGTAGKLAAHREGQLHRAFSVIVWNRTGEILLQKRAEGKYHSGLLWTNACCGHPRPGESNGAAAERRLAEEMGFACSLTEIGTFSYHAKLDRGMTENELVHVFRGEFNGEVDPDPNEAADYRWSTIAALREDVRAHPERFTVWFGKYINAEWPVALAPAA
jgi:isopentenyl-diphosphate Delta-isomerase